MNPELVVSILAMFCSAVSIAYTMYCNKIRSEEWNHMFEWMKIQEKINKEHREKVEIQEKINKNGLHLWQTLKKLYPRCV